MNKNLFFLAAVLCGSSSFAQSSADSDVVIVKQAPDAIYEGTSEHNRMGKKFEVTVMPFGVGPTAGFSAGANMAYRFDRNSSVLLSVSQITGGNSCSGTLSCSTKGQGASLYYKRFTNNSFYVSAGVDYRTVKYEEDMLSSYAFGFEGQSVGLGLAIGNQWQWDTLTLGCDWIGFSTPVISSTSKEFFSGTATQDDIDGYINTYVKDTRGIGLRFYVGASF